MEKNSNLSLDEQEALEYVRDIKGFYSHLTSTVCLSLVLMLINYLTSGSLDWSIIAAIALSIGVVSHGLSVFEVFNFFGTDLGKTGSGETHWPKVITTYVRISSDQSRRWPVYS